MTIDGLKCLKKRFENLPDYALSEDYDKEIVRLIDEKIAALSHKATDEEVQRAIDSRRIITIISELEEFANQRLDGNYIPPDLSKGEVLDVVLPILKSALQQYRTEPCEINYDTIFCGHRLGDLVAVARMYEEHGQSVTDAVWAIRYGYDEATKNMMTSMQALVHLPMVEPDPPRADLTDGESTQSGAIRQARGDQP